MELLDSIASHFNQIAANCATVKLPYAPGLQFSGETHLVISGPSRFCSNIPTPHCLLSINENELHIDWPSPPYFMTSYDLGDPNNFWEQDIKQFIKTGQIPNYIY